MIKPLNLLLLGFDYSYFICFIYFYILLCVPLEKVQRHFEKNIYTLDLMRKLQNIGMDLYLYFRIIE